MTLSKKILNLGMMSVKVIVGMLSSIVVGTTPVLAQTSSTSPLLGQSQSNQDAVRAIVNTIKETANGPLNAGNVGDAIRDAAAKIGGYSAEQWASAINQLNLKGDALVNAVDAAASSLNVSQDNIVASMLVDTFSTQGNASAQEQLNELRNVLGDDIVDKALDTSSSDFAQAEGDTQPSDNVPQDIYNG